MGCHYLDVVFWALELRYPQTIEAEGPPVHRESCPAYLIVHYTFPERAGRPALKLTWSDGGKRPEELLAEAGLLEKKSGILFVGEKGMLFADYDHRQLLPAEKFSEFEPPAPTIPDSIGHYAEWIKACKTGAATTCNFDYSGALSEAVLLGNVAYRTGRKLEWEAANLRVMNAPEAMQFIRREYRTGWALL